MSKSTIAAIDLGTMTVRVGLYRPHDRGLMLTGFSIAEMPPDGGDETARTGAIIGALRTALTGVDRGALKLSYAISGQTVFTRFVKLPPSPPERVAQMVRFEAQQNVPFPMADVVWDYQLMRQSADSDLEAIIVAIKADMLDRLNAAVVSVARLPERVDVAPLALFNAVRFNYSDWRESLLVLDIGAKSTNLIFIEEGKAFVRGVPIAGNQITQALAKDMNLGAEEAEALKRSKGFVGLGGAYEDPADDEAARASKVIRGVMTRLHSEVTRSVNFYKGQQGGSEPTRVLLTGGSSVLPYMNLFFQDKLGIPVEMFNPFRNVAVGPGVDRANLSKSAHLLGETVGVALREVGECPIEVDLVPQVSRAKREAREKAVAGAGIVAAILLIFGCLGAAQMVRAKAVDERLSAESRELAKLKAEAAKLETQEGSFQANFARAGQLLEMGRRRLQWARLLDELNKIVPVGIWVTRMEPAIEGAPADFMAATPPPKAPGEPPGVIAANELMIKGFYEAYDKDALENPDQAVGERAIRDFLERMTKSEYFDMTTQDIQDPKRVTTQIKVASEKKLALEFQVRVKLKEPVPLSP
ncbi:MAG: type IV pilus assembly protein PilM [Verrucomicrobiae bacterium]|nr:type IV pilus assembly protein PilM [Verrucomicrobiae bacterium]